VIPRRSPLKRYVRLRRKRKEPRRSSRVRDPLYLDAVRGLECVDCGAPPPSDPSHMGDRGLGQKCSDLEAVPQCRQCHRHFHDATGPYAGWTKDMRKDHRGLCIRYTQRRLGVVE
jgi:hypothetical protein